MADELNDKIQQVRRKIVALTLISLPNEPISGFSILDPAFLKEWGSRLEAASKSNLIEEISALLDEFELPELDASEARHDHLIIYHQVSQLRELARTVLSEAMSLGYPHDLGIIAKTNEIAPELKNIATSLDRIEARIDLIQAQASPIGDGVAISVGPLSVNLTALKRAAQLARSKIEFTQESTNVSALILALSQTANIANNIGRQINELVSDIPRRFRVALSEVVRLAFDVADKGVQLLKAVRKQQQIAAMVSGEVSPDEQARAGLLEVAATLKSAREGNGNSIVDVAMYLKIRTGFVRAIEEGRFNDLPGRTYAIGWVQTYVEFLKMPRAIASSLMDSLRKNLSDGPYYYRREL